MDFSAVASGGGVKLVGAGSIGLIAVGAVTRFSSIWGTAATDSIPTIAITGIGLLGLIWSLFEWFKSKREKIHADTESLLKERLAEADKDVNLAIAARRLLQTQWEDREREWDKQRRTLTAEVAELTAQVAALTEKSGEHERQNK